MRGMSKIMPLALKGDVQIVKERSQSQAEVKSLAEVICSICDLC